jgi:hypothetical protein
MRVEIIEKSSRWELEVAINRKLSESKPSEIFDIKYTGSGNRPPYSVDYYSAMIIYNEN